MYILTYLSYIWIYSNRNLIRRELTRYLPDIYRAVFEGMCTSTVNGWNDTSVKH